VAVKGRKKKNDALESKFYTISCFIIATRTMSSVSNFQVSTLEYEQQQKQCRERRRKKGKSLLYFLPLERKLEERSVFVYIYIYMENETICRMVPTEI